jgi:hypothetical protein
MVGGMAGDKVEYNTFKEAICAYYGWSADKYEKRLFFLAIPPSRRFLALPIYWFNRPFFAVDFGIIDSLGDSRSEDEFTGLLDELSGTTRVERSIRRGVLGIRITGTRLLAEWHKVAAYVKAPDYLEKGTVTPKLATDRNDRVDRSGRLESPGKVDLTERVSEGSMRDLSVVVLRRLRRAAADIGNGVPMEKAVESAGLAGETEFRQLVMAHGEGDPVLGRLREQFLLKERIRVLEAENGSLKSKLADREDQLYRLRSGMEQRS